MAIYSTFNPSAKDTHLILDEYYMAVIKDDPASKNDAGFRMAMAYKAWGDYHLYEIPISTCIRKKFESPNAHIYHMQYRRHPALEWGTDDMSRDHVTGLLILAYFGVLDSRQGSMARLRNMVEHSTWRISKKAVFTIDMWAWMKGILNNRWRTLFYALEIPIMIFASWWNAYLLKKGNFTLPELNQTDFVMSRINYDVTEEQARLREKMYPYYSVETVAWQNYINPDSLGKRWLSKIILGMTGEHNYLVRLLCGDMTVTKEQVLMYLDMTGSRWGVLLNEACRRTVRFLSSEESKYNCLEGDLLITIWNEVHPEDQIEERLTI